MFMDPKFFIFNLSTFFLFVWFMIPYLYLPDHMLNYGYEEKDSARLISTIGVFNTVGMLVLGIIGDRPWINVPKVYAVCLLSELKVGIFRSRKLNLHTKCFPFFSLRSNNSSYACSNRKLLVTDSTLHDFWNYIFEFIFFHTSYFG